MKRTAIGLAPVIASFLLASCGGTSSNESNSTQLLAQTSACYAAWSGSTVYTAGQTASYNGVNYTAAYWTQNQNPSTNSGASGSGKPWISNGTCGTVQPPPPPPPSCQVWTEGVTYTAGQVVSYQGASYTALITHTAYVGAGWDPKHASSLWAAGGTCSTTPPCDKPGGTVALVVDSAFNGPLQSELSRLSTDIQNDLSVCTSSIVVDAASKPSQIRSALQGLYASSGLQGALLIGDIPGVMEGDYVFNGSSTGASLTDTYYEVLGDFWKDPDGNGIFNLAGDADRPGDQGLRYDYVTPERDRDIWTGRLTPPKDMTDRVAVLRAYLDRDHAYRTGQQSYQQGMVYFNSVGHNGYTSDYELDQATNQAGAQSFYQDIGLFPAPSSSGLSVVWNNDLAAQLQSWRTLIQQQKEYAYINVHGAPTFQEFGTSLYMQSTDFQSTPSNALLVDMDSCSTGDFSAASYFAGHALFSGQTLAVRAFTVPVFIVGTPAAILDRATLADGLTLGQARKASSGLDISVLFGDPTLRLRHPAGGAALSVDQSKMVFPDVSAGAATSYVMERPFSFTNTGTTAIKVYRSAQQMWSSWNGLGALNRVVPNQSGGYDSIDPMTGVEFESGDALVATLAPGQTKTLTMYFDAPYPGMKPGQYRWKQTFYTNSPAIPVFTVNASQKVLQ